jgi:prepilin-type N-terminal cleavage/methylation domain-containing protein
MPPRRSTRTSTASGRAGFSLVELLVTTLVAGVSLSAATLFFATHVGIMRSQGYRIEAEQAMRGSLDAITRDLRLAGACLPQNGQFIALDGQNIPGGDSITIRTGMVGANLTCYPTSLTLTAPAGTTLLNVVNGAGFTPGTLGYVRHPNGSGQLSVITAAGATTINITNGLTQDYPTGSGVYAVDERIYSVGGTPDMPLLMLQINRGVPEAFAAGMHDLQIKYVLDRNCPTCDMIDLPSSTAEWWVVNEVKVTATVGTIGAVRPQDSVTVVATSTGKPRNLLP